jgi:hypothetical protein
MKTIKISSLFLIAAMMVLFATSCKEVKDAAAINISYDLPRMNFIYYKQPLKATEVLLCSAMVRINLDSALNANGLSSGVVGSTYLTIFTLTIDDPPSANFNWLQSARTQFAQDAGFTTAVDVASAVNNDPNSKVLTMTTNNVNIRSYLGNTSFYLRVYATMNGPLPYDWIGMYITSQLKMTLQPLN